MVVLDAPAEHLADLTRQLAEKEIRLTMIHRQTNAEECPVSHFSINLGLDGETLDAEIKALLKTVGETQDGIDVFVSFKTDPLVNFLFAKHLNRWYRHSPHPARKVFLVVTHLDGQLGTSGEGQDLPETGALFGLVKTLSQEWNHVFCRAVDFGLGLSSTAETHHVLQEMQDVDTSLAEVGWTMDQRWTIGLETLGKAHQ